MIKVWSRYCDQLASKKMSVFLRPAPVLLPEGVTWHGRTTLMSRDAADTRIPAVWRLSAAHHGWSAMPALYSPGCYLRAGHTHVRVSNRVFMNLDDHRQSRLARHLPLPSEQVLIRHATIAIDCNTMATPITNFKQKRVNFILIIRIWTNPTKHDLLHSLEFFLPLHITLATSTILQINTQLLAIIYTFTLCHTSPHQSSATLSIPTRLYKSSLEWVSNAAFAHAPVCSKTRARNARVS